jgi:hypothetical protein
LFILSIDETSPAFGESPSSERQELVRILQTVAEEIGRGHALSGDIIDRNRQNVGTYEYKPVARPLAQRVGNQSGGAPGDYVAVLDKTTGKAVGVRSVDARDWIKADPERYSLAT